jgi:Calcineurin-like phosphoesterase
VLTIHPAGDFHIDKPGNTYRRTSALDRDVVVVIAGDWGEPWTFWAPEIRKVFPENRIIALAGNHDFWSNGDPKAAPGLKTTWEFQRDNAPKVAEAHDIIWLDGGYSKGEAIIEDVRFLGATGWTSFEARPGYMSIADAIRSAAAVDGMGDYRAIKVGRGRSKDMFRPQDSIADHRRAVKWLESSLATPHDGETVVITHMAPSFRSLQDGKPTHDMDWCYASDLEYLMQGDNAPSLWIHGHIHACQDYEVGNTRVVANPRGYPAGHWHTWREGGPRENPAFDEDLVIEVGRPLTLSMGM